MCQRGGASPIERGARCRLHSASTYLNNKQVHIGIGRGHVNLLLHMCNYIYIPLVKDFALI